MECPGAILHVVYTYTVSGTTDTCQSLRVPLTNLGPSFKTLTDVAAEPNAFQAIVEVQEPGPIVMKQSGVVLSAMLNNETFTVYASGQTGRPYVRPSATVRDFSGQIIHRCDHSNSVWDLMRGRNALNIMMLLSADTDERVAGGYAIINYHSKVAATGISSHARTTVWPILTLTERTVTDSTSVTPDAPFIPERAGNFSNLEPDYTMFGVCTEVTVLGVAPLGYLMTKRLSGEGPGTGWVGPDYITWIDNAELGTKINYLDWTRFFYPHGISRLSGHNYERSYRDPSLMDITRTRPWLMHSISSVANGAVWSASLWMTHHTITYTLSGQYLVDGNGVPDDSLVEVMGYDPTSRQLKYLRRTTTSNVGEEVEGPDDGNFSVVVHDDTLVYVAYGRESAYPGASTVGYIQRNGGNTEAPKVVARGPAASSTGTLATSAVLPIESLRDGDLWVLYLQAKNGENITTPGGWTEATDSPQDATACRLEVFYGVVSGEYQVDYGYLLDKAIVGLSTVADPGDHLICPGIIIVRGADPVPEDVTEGGTAATSTSVTITGDTTTVDNTLILAAVANATDSATLQGSAFANSNLSGLHQVASFNAVDGTGGGIDVAAGVQNSAGAVGNTTATLASTSTQAKHMLAIKPRTYSVNVFDINVNTGIGGGGGLAVPGIGAIYVR
jgi:hypothetical protein